MRECSSESSSRERERRGGLPPSVTELLLLTTKATYYLHQHVSLHVLGASSRNLILAKDSPVCVVADIVRKSS